jgi:hypothetical protein
MYLTLLPGYPDLIGRRFAWVGYGNGPTSYVATGDPVSLPTAHTFIDSIFGEFLTVSGTYVVIPLISAVGPRPTWNLIWKYATAGSVASVAQNVAGSGMTPGTYTVTTSGGGTGASQATIQVVVLTATTIATPTVLNPGSGFTSIPTATLTGTGGTPATLTVTLSTIDAIVPAGANLSAQQVQIAGYGGEY